MNRALRLLMIEDSLDDAALVVRELRKSGFAPEFVRVDNRTSLLAELDRGPWDVILCDYSMPGFNGKHALEVLRSRDQDTPFIFVSGTIGEDVAVEAMRAGAQDYVIKGNLKRLVPAIERELGLTQARKERRLLEAQLSRAQRMESVGILAGGIAHDFNNLLGAITMFAELAASDIPASDPRRADIDSIQDAVQRATTLTRQLLAFSRQQVMRPTVVDFNMLIAEMMKMLRRFMGADIEVTTNLSPGPSLVRADASQLEQVLLNLAVNARDAMPTGGRIVIATTAEHLGDEAARLAGFEQGGDFVRLTVSDTGVGMSAEVAARAFEPFFTTKGQKGTGLGLATVYGIVRQSGGRVSLASEPGKGCTFTIHLPSVENDAAAIESVPEESDGAIGGLETILLAEDDPAVRLALSTVLTRLGYRLLVARNAQEALIAADEHAGSVHLLISDVVMPGMDGRTLIETVRKSRPELKALLMSGYAGDPIAQRGVIESGIPFLQKPFTSTDVARKVREVLDARVESRA